MLILDMKTPRSIYRIVQILCALFFSIAVHGQEDQWKRADSLYNAISFQEAIDAYLEIAEDSRKRGDDLSYLKARTLAANIWTFWLWVENNNVDYQGSDKIVKEVLEYEELLNLDPTTYHLALLAHIVNRDWNKEPFQKDSLVLVENYFSSLPEVDSSLLARVFYWKAALYRKQYTCNLD